MRMAPPSKEEVAAYVASLFGEMSSDIDRIVKSAVESMESPHSPAPRATVSAAAPSRLEAESGSQDTALPPPVMLRRRHEESIQADDLPVDNPAVKLPEALGDDEHLQDAQTAGPAPIGEIVQALLAEEVGAQQQQHMSHQRQVGAELAPTEAGMHTVIVVRPSDSSDGTTTPAAQAAADATGAAAAHQKAGMAAAAGATDAAPGHVTYQHLIDRALSSARQSAGAPSQLPAGTQATSPRSPPGVAHKGKFPARTPGADSANARASKVRG